MGGSGSAALVKQLTEKEMIDMKNVINLIDSTSRPVTTNTPVTTEAPMITEAPVTNFIPTTVVPVTTNVPATTRGPVTTLTPVTSTTQRVIVDRKPPTATRVLGTPRFVQLGSGRPISVPNASIVPSTTAPGRAPATQRTPKAISSGEPKKGNYEWEGKRYLLTWRSGRNNFDWESGRTHCEGEGMRLISLDSKDKTDHFFNLVSGDRAPYFWSGGKVSRDSRSLNWLNGVSEPVSRGQHPWSFTGRTGPQPDGGEFCLAILNNFYRDGVKYHDVACHHRKPVVCEE